MTRMSPCQVCLPFFDRIATLSRRVCPGFILMAMLACLTTPVFASTVTTTSLAVTPVSPVNVGAVATLTD